MKQTSNLPENKHEIDKIREYESKGYTSSFVMKNGALEENASGKRYEIDDIIIEKEIRYEGMSNPADMSILYVLRMKDGTKGLVLRPCGSKSNTGLDEFLSRIPVDDSIQNKRTDLGKMNPNIR